MAGVLSAGMFSTGVFAADTDLKGEVNTFIAASLSNAMEEIQKDFNETYPDVEILYNADSSGTLQTQIEEGARCDIFFSAADKQMDALVDEDLAKKDTVEDILENKVVLIKPKDGETKVTGFENITDAANIALAGDSVPVGQYSREIFDNLGITDEVQVEYVCGGQFYGDADITAYMDTWYGSKGVEVVFACGGGIYTSAAEAAVKTGGKVIGVDSDQSATIDDYKEGLTVTSAMKGLQVTIDNVLDAILDNEWDKYVGKIENLGMESPDPAENYVQLPEETTQWDGTFTKEDYQKLVQRMYNGEYEVFSDSTTFPETEITATDYGSIK